MTEHIEAAPAQQEAAAQEPVAQEAPAAAPAAAEQGVSANITAQSEKNPLEQSFEVVVPAAAVTTATRAELRRIAKRFRMAGFRPGHVPMHIVEQVHGMQVSGEVIERLLNDAYRKAVEEKQLQVAGSPRAEALPAQPGQDLHFKMFVEVLPEVTLPDLKGLDLKRFTCEVTDAEVEKTIGIMVKQRVTYELEEGRRAAADDRVTVDFTGTKNGETFKGGSAEGFAFVLNQGRMLPEFETAVTGMAAGESKTFDLTFPANYGNAELAGQQVTFSVTCNKVEKPNYPAVDEEFAKQLGVDSLEAMRTEIRRNLERETKERARQRTAKAVCDALVGATDFPLPRAMVAEQQQALANEMQEQMKRYGTIKEGQETKMPLEIFADQAARQVRLGLIFGHIARTQNLTVSHEEIAEYARTFASAYEEPDAVVQAWLKDEGQSAALANQLMEDKVVGWLLEQAGAGEEALEMDALMGPAVRA